QVAGDDQRPERRRGGHGRAALEQQHGAPADGGQAGRHTRPGSRAGNGHDAGPEGGQSGGDHGGHGIDRGPGRLGRGGGLRRRGRRRGGRGRGGRGRGGRGRGGRGRGGGHAHEALVVVGDGRERGGRRGLQ